ncbi:MAG: arylesterase [Candidatus Latescibacteria bacterium]|nr:arylesterase [Candidatus Latescibacterota bacterium]
MTSDRVRAFGGSREASGSRLSSSVLGRLTPSISGQTTSGALARLPALLKQHRPRIAIIELGGNDGLRGLPIAQIRSNLQDILDQLAQSGAQILLIAMRVLPNLGPLYTEKFRQVYADLASEYQVTLAPFLLQGIAAQTKLMQSDGIHPRAEAQTRILDNVWPTLVPLLSVPQ